MVCSPASFEAPFAQPLRGDPLVAGDDRGSAMERARGRVGALVAEEHRVPAARSHLQMHVGEGGATALFRIVEVDDDRGHPLPTPAQDGRRAGLRGVEIVVVGLVFGAGPVVQHLQALAVLQGPVHQPGDARFQPGHHGVFLALEEHAVAGAVVVDFLAARARGDGERPGHARAGRIDDGIAFLGRQQVAEQHHARLGHGHEHFHAAVADIDAAGGLRQVRLRHARGCRMALLHRQRVQVLAQHVFHRVGGHVLAPARVEHGLQHGGRTEACLRLRDDPGAQFRRDGLGEGGVRVGARCNGAVGGHVFGRESGWGCSHRQSGTLTPVPNTAAECGF